VSEQEEWRKEVMKPNKEHIEKWIAALPSFDQAVGALRSPRGFCCLGVACEVFRRETDQGRWNDDELEAFDRFTFLGENNIMPIRVAEWYGLDENPYLMIRDEEEPATTHNDGDTGVAPKSFEEIAEGLRALIAEHE
jgi:hypothetical protein